MKTALIAALLFFFGLSALGQQDQQSTKAAASGPAPYVIPPEAAHQVNPVKSTPESLADGKKWYGYDCAMCHGKNGDGKGEVGADMKLKVSAFSTSATLKDRTDGELFYIIKNGKGDMPPEGNRVKSAELWNLVNYVRSLSKNDAPSEDKPPK